MKIKMRMTIKEVANWPQQKVYAMWEFSAGIKSNFLISISNGGQFGAGRA